MWFGLRDRSQELYQLREQLKAERALCGQYDKLTDELLEVNQKQREVIAAQSQQLAKYQAMVSKLRPQVEAVRDWCRGQQHAFRESGDTEC